MVIGWWGIPLVLTVVFMVLMFRPLEDNSDYGVAVEGLLRLFWLIPILAIWVIYLGIMVVLK